MTIVCPCCRAGNDAGPACRRCKADLSLLFEARTRRAEQAKTKAIAALLARDYREALASHQQWERINRPDAP